MILCFFMDEKQRRQMQNFRIYHVRTQVWRSLNLVPPMNVIAMNLIVPLTHTLKSSPPSENIIIFGDMDFTEIIKLK